MISAEEFAKQMKELQETCKDREAVHSKMDTLMCDVLTELGYGEGVEIFKDTDNWYA